MRGHGPSSQLSQLHHSSVTPIAGIGPNDSSRAVTDSALVVVGTGGGLTGDSSVAPYFDGLLTGGASSLERCSVPTSSLYSDSKYGSMLRSILTLPRSHKGAASIHLPRRNSGMYYLLSPLVKTSAVIILPSRPTPATGPSSLSLNFGVQTMITKSLRRIARSMNAGM
jgi:hypothetical protein